MSEDALRRLVSKPNVSYRIESALRKIEKSAYPDDTQSAHFMLLAWDLADQTGFKPKVLKTYRDWINHNPLTDRSHAHLLVAFPQRCFAENSRGDVIATRALRIDQLGDDLQRLFELGNVDVSISSFKNSLVFRKIAIGLFLALTSRPMSVVQHSSMKGRKFDPSTLPKLFEGHDAPFFPVELRLEVRKSDVPPAGRYLVVHYSSMNVAGKVIECILRISNMKYVNPEWDNGSD